jgi:hypothetical protein
MDKLIRVSMKKNFLRLLVLTILSSIGCATGVNTTNSTQEWAELNGYYSAHFGMNEGDLINVIHNDFGKNKSEVLRQVHPNENTISLEITTLKLSPEIGGAKVFYILDYKSKRLVQVNVIWGRPVVVNPNKRNIVEVANHIRNNLFQKLYQKEGFALNSQLGEGVILVFQGKDRKGRAVRLLLNNPKDENISLTLSYIEKPID